MALVRFLVIGVANTLVGLAAIYVAMYFMGMGDVAANAFGYAVGIMLGFMLNKSWTFKNGDGLLQSLARYVLVLVVAYSANLAAVLLASKNLQINSYLAQAVGILPYTVIGYLGSRYFAFPERRTTDSAPNTLDRPKSIVFRPVDLSIVVPCYNEEQVLPETNRRLKHLLSGLIERDKATSESRIVYVDDGSIDKTWKIIETLAESSEFVGGIKLSKNRGHQNALLAGLFSSESEVIISIDADLQDDLSAIEEMLDCYGMGCDIVYGVRASRQSDTFFKSFTAKAYYHLLKVMGVDIVYNHADYRLLSRRAIDSLKQYGEVNLFIRGIIPQLGYVSTLVYYDRAERFAGESKYPLRKMLSFAWQGITSFSTVPLRAITLLGMLVLLGSIGLSVWVFWVRFFTDSAIPGWASIVLPIYFIGGVQMLCLGVIGEYVAKIYLEVKRRPRYFIDKKV